MKKIPNLSGILIGITDECSSKYRGDRENGKCRRAKSSQSQWIEFLKTQNVTIAKFCTQYNVRLYIGRNKKSFFIKQIFLWAFGTISNYLIKESFKNSVTMMGAHGVRRWVPYFWHAVGVRLQNKSAKMTLADQGKLLKNWEKVTSLFKKWW